MMNEKDLRIQELQEKMRQAETDIRLVMRTGLPCVICAKADGDCERWIGLCDPVWRGKK